MLKKIKKLKRVFLGAIFGYSLGNFGGGESVGVEGRVPSIIFNFKSWQIHLHHWLICFLILLFLIAFFAKNKKLKSFLLSLKFGFLVGLMLQGILEYSDWYFIILKRN